MKKISILELGKQGEFTNSKQSIYFIPTKQTIRFLCGSKFIYNHQPILLSSLNTNCNLSHFPSSKGDTINQSLTKFEGSFTIQGYWNCEVVFQKQQCVIFQMVFLQQNKVIKAAKPQYLFIETMPYLNDKIIDLNQFICQSLLPRAMGKIQNWYKIMTFQKWIGYNAFHFPPISKLGQSRSYYSISNHLIPDNQFMSSFQELQQLIQSLHNQECILFTDIILNHISNNSDLISQIVDGLYTTKNTPQLTSTFIVDQTIFQFGQKMKKYQIKQLPEGPLILQKNLSTIHKMLMQQLHKLKIEQYFLLSMDTKQKMIKQLPPSPISQNIFSPNPNMSLSQYLNNYSYNLGVKPFGVQINLEQWKKLKLQYEEIDLQSAIIKYNNQWRDKVCQWINNVPQSVMRQLTYQSLNKNLPQNIPWVKKAFSTLSNNINALNNGWVMDADPLQNLVTSKNFYYLRRNVFIWGDLLKLNFGKDKKSVPSLWKHIKKYVMLMAKYFDGFRLDNLHGTPLHVAQYMIKKARKVNKNLLLFGQLFTGSQDRDAIYVKRLGLNALVRQTNTINNCIFQQIGKHLQYVLNKFSTKSRRLQQAWTQKQKEIRKFVNACKPFNMIYDQTHDNQSPKYENRVPFMFLLTFIDTFLGSTKGYDLLMQKIHVCNDDTKYPIYQTLKTQNKQRESILCVFFFQSNYQNKVEIIGSWNWQKKILMHHNGRMFEVKINLTPGSYQYKFIVNGNWTNDTKKSINDKFNHQVIIDKDTLKTTSSNTLMHLRQMLIKIRKNFNHLKQKIINYHGENVITIKKSSPDSDDKLFIFAKCEFEDKDKVNNYDVQFSGQIQKVFIAIPSFDYRSNQVSITYSYNFNQYFDLRFNKQTNKNILQFGSLPIGFCIIIFLKKKKMEFEPILNFDNFTPQQINYLMFSCEAQENVYNNGCYYVPNKGKLVYAGFASAYTQCKKDYMYGEGPIYKNIQKGNWLIDFFINRLNKKFQNFALVNYLQQIKLLGGTKKLFAFTILIRAIKSKVKETILKRASKLKINQNSPNIIKNLLFASYQFINRKQNGISIAAGLPHFSTGWSRQWGRDTFISFKGNLLITGLWKQAKEILLKFGRSLRHGLIPNLLDDFKNPRYNCRDATWWYLYSIFNYMEITGDNILNEEIDMVFLSDQKNTHEKLKNKGQKKILKLYDVIQEIFQKHATGIQFRQWNAGKNLDQNMDSQGFKIILRVDWQTGFIVGGNSKNCLTWMDKMGSSQYAQNKSWPATSRNGSPVQIVGLLKRCLNEVIKLNESNLYPYQGVNLQGKKISFKKWSGLIKDNFMKWYWIDNNEEKWHFNIKKEKTVHRGILKDLVKSQNLKVEHYFRPNGLITIVLCPQLIPKNLAQQYLKNIEQNLIYPQSIGIKTLSQFHTSLYCHYYDNNDQSNNMATAKGFSYHNGPQWVWLYGYYMLALIQFTNKQKHQYMSLLINHIKHMNNNQWSSLPELTNHNGQENKFSCQSQAWSIGTILQSVYEINK